jgi:hypothetical protein
MKAHLPQAGNHLKNQPRQAESEARQTGKTENNNQATDAGKNT